MRTGAKRMLVLSKQLLLISAMIKMGNITNDPHQGVSVTYNHLNLPTVIQKSASEKIEYVYDGAGNKLSKIVTNHANVTTADYVGSCIFENGQLKTVFICRG